MAQVNFRIDDETKRRAEKLFSSMGLTMSGAITIFIQQTLNRNEIPFPVQGQKPYREKLEQAFRDYENGKKNFHYHDLIEVEEDEPMPRAKPRRTASRRRGSVA